MPMQAYDKIFFQVVKVQECQNKLYCRYFKELSIEMQGRIHCPRLKNRILIRFPDTV